MANDQLPKDAIYDRDKLALARIEAGVAAIQSASEWRTPSPELWHLEAHGIGGAA
jgi:hypothetical protein